MGSVVGLAGWRIIHRLSRFRRGSIRVFHREWHTWIQMDNIQRHLDNIQVPPHRWYLSHSKYHQCSRTRFRSNISREDRRHHFPRSTHPLFQRIRFRNKESQGSHSHRDSIDCLVGSTPLYLNKPKKTKGSKPGHKPKPGLQNSPCGVLFSI